ncbi:hypothetical protein ACX1C1_01320 [Paenibacillus sp. strain BS8-2]
MRIITISIVKTISSISKSGTDQSVLGGCNSMSRKDENIMYDLASA